MTKLNIEILDRFVAALEAQDAPVLSRLNPGLSDEEIDESLSAIGIVLPEEPRLWWKWHNGASLHADDVPAANAWSAGPDLRLLTLDEAIEYRADEIEIAEEVEPDDPDYWWNPAWLPFTSARTAIDCSTNENGCSVVRNTDPMWDPNDRGPQVTASVGDLVELWTLALTNRIWYWDPSARGHGAWFQDHDLLTRELLRTSQF